jgi:asparagine synthase (glutamine-hydrolysing)
MGVRRLSIIDVKGGKQPVHNEDETVWTVFNGEIYNYLFLRHELENKGHKFYTNSDTEVLVHLYEEYGESLVNKLRGMFAFAIWDSRKRKLMLARDRMGKKPLYYFQIDDRFYFASEIKAILLDKRVPRTVDKIALGDFLTFRASVGEKTLFKDIMKLLPGHIMIVKDGEIRKIKYWEIKMNPGHEDEDYYIKLLRKTLEESVRMRLVSEVPLGAYLSGGVDSSTIVALMKKFSEEPVKTFSVGFGNPFDETKYAREVSEVFGTGHKEFIVKEDCIELLPQIIWHFDEPVADPAAIPTYLLSKYAKKYVTVVMTGEGADELFAGYFQYKVVTSLENPLKKHAASIAKIAPRIILNKVFEYTSSLGEQGMKRFGTALKEKDYRKQYMEIVSVFNEKEKSDLTGFSNTDYMESFGEGKTLNSLLTFDIKTELPNDLLMKVDKMTMAKSIEARVPFLDQEIVEISARMPVDLKLKGMKDKYILRKVAKDILPTEIAKRKKHRFFAPIDDWKIKDIASSLLSKEVMEKRKLNVHYLEKLMQDFENSKLYYSRQLWSLINFELWYRIFVEGQKIKKIL